MSQTHYKNLDAAFREACANAGLAPDSMFHAHGWYGEAKRPSDDHTVAEFCDDACDPGLYEQFPHNEFDEPRSRRTPGKTHAERVVWFERRLRNSPRYAA